MSVAPTGTIELDCADALLILDVIDKQLRDLEENKRKLENAKRWLLLCLPRELSK